MCKVKFCLRNFYIDCLVLNEACWVKLSGSTCNLLACCPRASSAIRCWMPCQFCLGLPYARLKPASPLRSLPILFIQLAYHEASPVILQRGCGGESSGSSGSSSNNYKNDNNNNNHNKQSSCGVAYGPKTMGLILCQGSIPLILRLNQKRNMWA